MDNTRKTRCIANSYYNQGLERARIRDLTGASESLKKSLHFNKYQTDARNLLGLIYYEMGETAQALVQWVISTNLQPEENRASHYLSRIQGKKGRLETENQLARKYNQGLSYAQNGSDDLAVLQLNKVVESKPGYVKAQLLLALLYLIHEDYAKAGKSLYKVLQVDRANPKALWYMSIVKEHRGRTEPEKRKLKNVFSHNQMQDDDIILPPSYQENTKDQAVLNILLGVLLGAAVIFFLVMPAQSKSLNLAHNKELLKYSEQLSQANQKAQQMEAQVEGLKQQKEAAETALSNMTNNQGSILNQYKILMGILNAYKKGDFNTAVTLYATLNPDLITDKDVQAIVAEVKTDMEANGYQVLEKLGDEAAAAKNTAGALDYYLKSLAIHADNWPLKYKVALIYKETGQQDKANDLFTDIISHSKDDGLIQQAKGQRGF